MAHLTLHRHLSDKLLATRLPQNLPRDHRVDRGSILPISFDLLFLNILSDSFLFFLISSYFFLFFLICSYCIILIVICKKTAHDSFLIFSYFSVFVLIFSNSFALHLMDEAFLD